MPDFRSLLHSAEAAGRLRRITQPVDPSWEPACLAKWMFLGLPMAARFALLFEQVEGSGFPLVTGALGASTDNYALALGVPADEINARWSAALSQPIEPRLVERAPCQEVVRLGAEARLSVLPIPVWTPGKDAAPYITAPTVNRHATGGWQNIGVYRTMVLGEREVAVNLNPGRQGHACAQSYLDQGRPAPVAWVIGGDPSIYLAAVANLPPGIDEATIAGGLAGAPIELVRARTSELLVPANAELIIEGEVLPGQAATEGPFGESAGYMSAAAPKPIARITAITHRRDAIYYGLASQMPPSESTTLQSLSNAGLILHWLRAEQGEKTVCDAHIDLMFGGGSAHIVVAMTPRGPGHAKHVGRLIAQNTSLKRITIVDEDIDIRDQTDLAWVMSAHFDPARDTEILTGFPAPMDHAVTPDAQGRKLGSKLVVDATRSHDMGAFSLPSGALMEQARATWRAAGLPEREPPRRLRQRLERS